MKNFKNNPGTWLTIGLVLLALWLGIDAFFGLVGDLYHFLDGYIWAFFAGIIAFFIAIWLIIIMFYITLFIVAGVLALLGVIFGALKK